MVSNQVNLKSNDQESMQANFFAKSCIGNIICILKSILIIIVFYIIIMFVFRFIIKPSIFQVGG